MTPQEMSHNELLEAYKATQRRIEVTSMNAEDLYAMIRLDTELEARGLCPVTTFTHQPQGTHAS